MRARTVLIRSCLFATTSFGAACVAGCFSQFGEWRDGGGGDDGAGGSTGETTTSETSSSSTCPTPTGVEDCLDGCDNDGDGDIDCADSDCAEYLCVGAFPTGWDGPVGLSLAGALPDCGAPFDGSGSRSGVEILAVPAASCACTCGAAAGGTCSGNLTMQRYTSSDCSGTPTPVQVPMTPACTGGVGTTGSGTATLAPTGGSCNGTATLTAPPPTTSARAFCEAPRVGGGCGAGVCVPPPPPADFEPRVCVVDVGDVACPSIEYTERHVVFTSELDDQRECPSCDCNDPTGGTCQGFVALYTSAACQTSAGGVTLGGACSPQSTVWSPSGANYQVTGVAQGGCTPVDPSPAAVGAIGGGDPITVCCTGNLTSP